MSTTQIRITIPEKLKSLLVAFASKYGLSTASYIKHLIIEDLRRFENLPVRQPSSYTLKAIKKGEKEFRQGDAKTFPLDDLDNFAKKL